MKYLFLALAFVALGTVALVYRNQISTSPNPTVSPSPTPVAHLRDENSAVETDIKTAIVEKHGTGENMTISVAKIIGDYAQGGASEEGVGGGMWFAKKVSGEWKLVWDGNGIITCDDIAEYPDFPSDMIPQCYDTDTEELVNR